ncbi:putative Sugar ABC transporter substrate-binding protein [Nostocoides japonicum T1-X7]|uniref:Putative Sugar ABC transporter substrate-binding protein n=1 Tax=Nostocoides japonicum T1-X7 TaxID=1194083 RepID=A0A077LVM4_9MICO|nr:extracellular solute-binding protein [Tetrasphaera japonica]CCH76044.1 putative Sugar ABC transporter substrate-binding protein [Tetrasphaera japonica T1-X7]
MNHPRATTDRRTFLGLALAGAAAVPLASCAPGGGGSSSATTSAGASVTTDASALGNVTIAQMDTWTDKTSLQAQWIVKVNAAFTQKYPNLKVKRTSGTFDDINKTLKLKLSDPSAPDVVPANNGWQGIGTLAKAGLIKNLTPWVAAYGWDKRIPATIARQHQVTPDGKSIGKGDFFGIPMAQGGFITIYYNRSKLAKLGVSVPTTFDAFQDALAKAKAGGEIPMMIGTQDQWLSTTTLFALMCNYAETQKISDFVYGVGGTAADTGMKEAATTYQAWAKAGYFPKNFAGTPSADSGTAFVGGSGVFYFYYSDSLPFQTEAKSNAFGTFLLPTQGDLRAVGASNQNFSIASNSKHADAAALWLDFVSSRAAGELAVQTGIMPFLDTFEATADTGPLLKDELGELAGVQKSDGFVPYFDWATPTMLDTMGAQCQLLLAGKITPEQLVAACQKDYDAFQKSQG